MECLGGSSGTWTDSIAILRYNQIAKADRVSKRLLKEKKRISTSELSDSAPFLTYPNYTALVSEVDIDRDYQNISHSIIDLLAPDAGEISWELIKGQVIEEFDSSYGISSFFWSKFIKKGWAKYHSSEDNYHPINQPTALLTTDWVIGSDEITFREPFSYFYPHLARFDLYQFHNVNNVGQFDLFSSSKQKKSYIFQNFFYMNNQYTLLLYLLYNLLFSEKKKKLLHL